MTRDSDYFHAVDWDRLPGFLGMRSVELNKERSVLEMEITDKVRNFSGGVHGGSVVALADTAAGYGCYANLPVGATGFTTLELKCNFIGMARTEKIRCIAVCIHRGKTTQVWDSTVCDGDTDRAIAEFRCTQFILYAKSESAKPEQSKPKQSK